MAALTKAACVMCGCVLGLTLGIDAGGPGGWDGLRVGIAEAQAGASIRERIENRKKREAKERAARERALKAERARLKGSRTKELPIGCAYDTEGSMQAEAEIYLCDGMRYQAVKDGDFQGYEVHPVDVDRGEINRERARRAKEAAKRQAAARKRRKADRIAELPPACTYDANASMESPTDLYSCDGVLYRAYEEDGEKGYEVVRPGGQDGAARPSGGGEGGAAGGSAY